MKKLAIAIGKIQGYFLRRIVRKSAGTFYFGSELMQAYPTKKELSHVIFASSITDKYISPRTNFSVKKRNRLLYVGRLAHEKGLQYLLQAVKILNEDDIWRIP